MTLKYIAVILAAGSGNRFGSDVPKQFLQVNSRYILSYSLDTFLSHPKIHSAAVVYNFDYEKFVHAAREQCSSNKPVHFIIGGKERSDSTAAALNYFQEECYLLFHDAARPLVSHTIITDCIEALSSFNAAGTAVPSTDTVFFSEDGRLITSVLPRACLFNAQTPQCFKRSILNNAYTKAYADPNFTATDDCGIVSKYLPDEHIAVVQGSTSNFKITYPTDLQLFSQLIKVRQ